MMSRLLRTCFAFWLVVAALSFPVTAAPIVLNPSDDGFVDFYSPTEGIAHNDSYVVSDIYSTGVMRGVIEFSLASITESIVSAVLTVNPYALPIHDSTIDIYGYESIDGILTLSDFDAGALIGVMELPSSLDFGENAFFDATNFLQIVNSPFVGFVFRADGVVLSSVEYNYGHPAQLTVSTEPLPSLPIPSAFWLFGTALLGIGMFRWKK
jgi:hypothetical protein